MNANAGRALVFCFFFFALPIAAWAKTFTVYPGAALDQKLTAEYQKAPTSQGFVVRVYVTKDSFEKVRAFYTPLYHDEHLSRKYASGPAKNVKLALFAIDAPKELYKSTYWFRITRPIFNARLADGTIDYTRAPRDETAILVVQKK